MFDKKMIQISREILTLKNLKKKSAMTIKTMELSFSITFNIIGAGTEYYSEKIAVMKMTTTNNLPPIAQIYFDVNDFDYRQLSVHKVIDTNGDLNFYVCIDADQNQNDIDAISHGQTVEITYTGKIVSTASTSITLSYINNEAPSPPVPGTKGVPEELKEDEKKEEKSNPEEEPEIKEEKKAPEEKGENDELEKNSADD